MTAKHVFFEGRVQGVGFRYTTKQLAKEFEVIGWVRNLADGRVEMQVMSEEETEVLDFVKEIEQSSLAHHIKKLQIFDIAPLDGVGGFSIR